MNLLQTLKHSKILARDPRINGPTLLAVFLATTLSCFAAEPTVAKEIPHEWNNVPRIVAIGDIHGAYDNFVAVLKNAGLVDDKLRWIGGKTHLVQTGDVVDRGPDSRKCMDLLIKLEKQAEQAGGRVHALIGNHEAMNVVGFLDYVSKEEFASYPDSSSTSLFNQGRPFGYSGHRRAFGPRGRYGRWIRSHNAAVRINGVLFSHGDWSTEFSALGMEEFNRRVRNELSGKASLKGGVTFHSKSPLQHRGLANVPLKRVQQEAHQKEVDRILADLRVTRMVVGHTVTEGVIEPRFGGKHISIDTGMLELYRGGHQVALEIEGGNLRAIHRAGKVPLPNDLDESTLFDYLVAVAAVDSQNPQVYGQLALQYRARGDLTAARDALEQLFLMSRPVPFRYHQELGDIYRELGDTAKARVQYMAYIEGLNNVINSTPDNLHLTNLLTGFCLKHNRELHGWQCNQCTHSCLRTVDP